MWHRFRHCRAYALATIAAVNLVPAIALANPESNTVTVTADVCEPQTATASITSPPDGTRTTDTILAVSGTTEASTIPVRIFRNGGLAGSAIPNPDGTWHTSVTLVNGHNSLVAAACQPGSPIDVYRETPGPGPGPAPGPEPPGPPGPEPGPDASPGINEPSTTTPGAAEADTGPFFLATDRVILRGTSQEPVTLSFTIVGGVAPYRMNLAWGDGSYLERELPDRAQQSFTHRFRAGSYQPLVEITDANGQKSVLTYVAEIKKVTEPPSAIGLVRDPRELIKLLVIEVALIALIFAFWEAYHQHHVRRQRDCPPGKVFA